MKFFIWIRKLCHMEVHVNFLNTAALGLCTAFACTYLCFKQGRERFICSYPV